MELINGSGQIVQGDSLLEIIDAARVFGINELPDGGFEIFESCDNWFSVTLTREHLIQLADELRSLAG